MLYPGGVNIAQLRAFNTRFRARPHRKPYTARHATSAFWKPLADACGSASINVDNCAFASTSHEFTHPARKRGVRARPAFPSVRVETSPSSLRRQRGSIALLWKPFARSLTFSPPQATNSGARFGTEGFKRGLHLFPCERKRRDGCTGGD